MKGKTDDEQDVFDNLMSFYLAKKKIANELPVFSLSLFEKKAFKQQYDMDVYKAFEIYIKDLEKEERFNTADSYYYTMTSLMRFMPTLEFLDITPDFLNSYEKWMLNQNRSDSTIGIYTRSLRAIYNRAIEDGSISRDYYPFGRNRFQPPTSANIKRALTGPEFARFHRYTPEPGSFDDRAKDYFIFSLQCNGINFSDLLRLKFTNIFDDKIVFYRKKTKRATRSKPKPIIAMITYEMQRIMDKWGNKDQAPGNFIFPLLTNEMTEAQQHREIQMFLRITNKHLNKIGKVLKFRMDLTTYTARHTFGTFLKRDKVDISYIQAALGHSSPITTEKYLDSLDDDKRKEVTNSFLEFMHHEVLKSFASGVEVPQPKVKAAPKE
jgi:integrase